MITAPVPGLSLPLALEADARKEDLRRLGYFCLTGAFGSLFNALGFAVAGQFAVAVMSAGTGILVFLLWRWILAGNGTDRLVTGLNMIATAVIVVLVAASLASGGMGSVASWYFGVVPMAVVFFFSVRRTLLWMGACMAAVLALAALESALAPAQPRTEALVVQVVAHLTLILFCSILAVAARLVRDQYVAKLALSLAAEQRAKHEAELARQAAEEASRAKSDFLAVMSHEIRTPLNGIIGLTQLLQRAPAGADQARYLQLVAQSGEALLHLVNNLLDFSKIEAGLVELEVVPFEPGAVARQALELVREEARAKGLALRAEIPPLPRVLGDSGRLHQILLNLLSNAVKFTPQGSVTLRCGALAQKPGWLRFEVADTGIGVAPEAQERLFQPFVQAEASTTRRFGGTGLGLSICRHLAGAMGGALGLHSVPAEGSVFWVELPFATTAGVSGAEPAPAVPATSPAGRSAVLRARVLLAEDNPVNQAVARGMLKHFGIHPEVVGDGLAAVEAAATGDFDIILMDCHMPLLDGFAASRAIRAQEPAGRRIPIVAMTAAAVEGDREQCLAAGMDDYLAKPVRMDDLRRLLDTWLPQSSGGA